MSGPGRLPRLRAWTLVPRAGLALVALLGAVASCGEDGADVDAGYLADTTVVGAIDEPGTAAAEARPGVARDAADATGLENFAVADDPRAAVVSETVAVELVSGAAVPLALVARAGAAPAPLDTLAPGGRLRVDLVGPRGRMEVAWRAVDGSGEGVVPVPLSPAPDSVLGLRVGDPAVP